LNPFPGKAEMQCRSNFKNLCPSAWFSGCVAAIMLLKGIGFRLRVVGRLHRAYEASYDENTAYGKVRGCNIY
jgi:hypothetical protein